MYRLVSVNIGWKTTKFLTLLLTVQKVENDFQPVITIVPAQVGQQVTRNLRYGSCFSGSDASLLARAAAGNRPGRTS